MSLADLTAADLRPHEGSTFSTDGQEIVLESVTAPQGDDARPFSLGFRGAAEPALPQQTHVLVHPELGELAVFLVPIGPGHYEAVFG